ncbi:ribosome assembly cofactor RimP [Mycoplasma sp. NEAQ87857]|uniref:ribosome assembly cofactor RimP n=1 Tax=Mycoplasma sp. NEAQ87857 TaxID=2683967 RepID=UPI001317078A|nr:ribosome assembly cofactor RimP [Mycoplasma sp. NEAQ87857]QGZ97892.1 ribosome assembly cofactor RimP [Mycoplasma sp. NEAQ87857]
MDYKKAITNQFGSIILEASLKSDLLEITLNTTNLNDVEQYTRKIFSWIIEQDWYDEEKMSLSIQSAGLPLEINLDDINLYINQMVKINTVKSFEGLNHFVVELLEDLGDEILVKWNKKGQFRKIKIAKDNIKDVEKYIKF